MHQSWGQDHAMIRNLKLRRLSPLPAGHGIDLETASGKRQRVLTGPDVGGCLNWSYYARVIELGENS
jgi:hypothetical protein